MHTPPAGAKTLTREMPSLLLVRLVVSSATSMSVLQ
tara:strand:- start:260 stop:367 length:108 start_codon:yes stop_codon:yes gene_type:complete